MKIINLKLYSFHELNREAKQNALNTYRGINVDFNWWDCVYEDFVWLCACMGLTLDWGKIDFSDLQAQGAGSRFAAKVDLIKLHDATIIKGWKFYEPKLNFPFEPSGIDRRVLALIKSGALQGDTKIIARSGNYNIGIDFGIYVDMSKGREHGNIFDELDKLEAWLRDIAIKLNQHLFQSLLNEYEFFTSDTSVIESVLTNECLFTADGRTANHLEQLTKRKH